VKTLTLSRAAAVAAALALAVTGCASNDTKDSGASNEGPVSGLRFLVPNSPGSGYDTTARAAVKAMEEAGIVKQTEVFNLSGAGGTVGLQRVVNEKGNGKLVMQMGLGVVGAAYTNKSKATLSETTPIARLIEEPEAIAVPKNSPYKTLADFVAAWKAAPGKTPVGGGSSPGGPDHLAPMLTAQAVGVKPSDVNFVSYDGGGELLAALLGSKIKAAFTGTGEVEEQAKAGQLRILAVTSAERVEGIDAPTLKEAGFDLTFTNWRGMVAPNGISDDAKKQLIDALERMHDSAQWKATLADKGWTDAFLTGDEFGSFLTSEDTRVREVLAKLGLA
jgi:putative tricarboxylic transport membrane protein